VVAWAVRASLLAAAAVAAGAPARAETDDVHSHLIPLPHPEILYPNAPALPPRTLHPRVFRPLRRGLPQHQHLLPLPHPELLHPRPQASFGHGFRMTATLRTDGSKPVGPRDLVRP
jgi:hypothetical protein